MDNNHEPDFADGELFIGDREDYRFLRQQNITMDYSTDNEGEPIILAKFYNENRERKLEQVSEDCFILNVPDWSQDVVVPLVVCRAFKTLCYHDDESEKN